MANHILWLENSHIHPPLFVSGLQAKGYRVECVPTGKAALAHLASYSPDLVVVNAASLRGNGKRTCQALRDYLKGLPILLICEAEHCPQENEFEVTQILVLPFTLRKLHNRIRALVPDPAGEVVHQGALTLFLDNHLVQVNGSEPRRLTPHLVTLLRTLMQRPGQVWTRAELFREVWQTDYVGDTRTLDTHISWLRTKIETDAQNPRYLKTVRGMGYRLDI
ncbi:MAG TPA: response regulator transcription factor [Anaerolineales bacterium]|nr:response regulator transcription factor [Anaerolineales bacterium]